MPSAKWSLDTAKITQSYKTLQSDLLHHRPVWELPDSSLGPDTGTPQVSRIFAQTLQAIIRTVPHTLGQDSFRQCLSQSISLIIIIIIISVSIVLVRTLPASKGGF
jgi:hypothetical protein